jgi:signal transduction histidine kinase
MPAVRLALIALLLAAPNDLDLTEAERAWLADHPVIRVAPDPDFPPFESFTLDGRYEGMAADYVGLLEKALGVRFEVVRAETWSEVLDLARARKVDVLPAAARSPQREEYLAFTEPHIVVPGVIISSRPYEDLDELLGKKVAVVVDYVWDDLLEHSPVEVRLVRVEDLQTGLELTSMGAVDAMISDLATTTTGIRSEGITNLRVVSRLDQKLELRLAVRKDWPELRSILDKALAAITPAERDAVFSRWVRLDEPGLLLSRTFWIATSAVLAFLVLLVVSVVAWNRTLRRKVAERTRDLEAAQAQLVQAAKMESVGRLAAGVAHEVKNPLAIIQMGADFLTAESGEDETVKGVLTDIDEAVSRADFVVKGLLDFSRDEKLELVPGAVNEVLQHSLHLVGHELRQRNIEVTERLGTGLPEIDLDRNKLQQVFINLFMNAAHAMEREGELTVSSRLADGRIRVEVADTGPGIPEENLAKLFDPFFTTKPTGEGTGLGLSVTRNIIGLHRGTIEIRNREGGGAQVLIEFDPKAKS